MFRIWLISAAVAAATLFALPDTSEAARVRVYHGPNRSRVVVRGPYRTYRYNARYPAYYAPRVWRNDGYVVPYGYGYSGYGAYGGYNRGAYIGGPGGGVWFRY